MTTPFRSIPISQFRIRLLRKNDSSRQGQLKRVAIKTYNLQQVDLEEFGQEHDDPVSSIACAEALQLGHPVAANNGICQVIARFDP